MRTLTRRARAVALVLPLLVVASAGCDIAMSDFREKQTAEWRKTYELQPGGRVEISNVNGKIDVEPASGNTVEVVAVKSARAASIEAAKAALERIEIQETISPTDIRIQTRMQRGGLFSGGNLQVEYTVRVPAGADVKFSTVNGAIEIAGLKGHINAETVNGGVKAREIAGPIEASTTNGGVEVDLTQLAEPGVRLGCTNGGIRLRLPGDAKATISARITNGGIDASGLQLDTTESSRRRLDGRMNGGGTRVDIEGTNGGIRISTR